MSQEIESTDIDKPGTALSNPMIWLIIAIPSSAVVMGACMLTLALKNDVSLVNDDYYKQGLEINRTLDRDQYAFDKGLAANISYDSENQTWVIHLSGPTDWQPEDSVWLNLRHATIGKNDLSCGLKPISKMSWYCNTPLPENGRWHLEIGTQQWRLTESLSLPEFTQTKVSAREI